MFYGVLATDGVVLLTDREHGKPIEECAGPSSVPQGYVEDWKWVDAGDRLLHVCDVTPMSGTPEEAALALSRLQYQSLPDSVAYELRALAPAYTCGATYAAGQRFMDGGVLYKADEDFVAPADALPSDESVPCTVQEDPSSAPEWSAPVDKHTYNKGSVVSHGGVTYRSKKNNNTDEPPSDKWEVVS